MLNKSSQGTRKVFPTSRTLDSLVELAPKPGTPSASSSGYGSQAVSSTNLSSEDSVSLRSISVDETPDTETKCSAIAHDLKPLTETMYGANEDTSFDTEVCNLVHRVMRTDYNSSHL